MNVTREVAALERMAVLSPVDNGGAFRGKIRVKMAAHM
jgi:hypothetical protein